jgi:predicted aspartyl protease
MSMKAATTRRAFITGALGAPSICRAAGLWLPVTRTRTNLALVPVFVGETRLSFVADTGAANSLIASEALTRLDPSDFESRGATAQAFAGGQATAQRIALRSVAISPGHGVALEVNAIAMAPLKEQFGAVVDGVLGMEILERYTLRIDLRKQRMDLLPPANVIARQSIPFDYNPRREILFQVRLDDHPVTALLDTGAVQTGVNWNAARQSGVNRNIPGLSRKTTIVGADGNIWDIHQYRFSSMQIGVIHWNRPTLVIADVSAFESLQLAAKPGAIVGMDFLDNRVITISFTRRRFTIQ